MWGTIFEAIMLICFGLAWPASIYKSYTSRSNNGKSLSFMLIIMTGYVAGMLHSIIDTSGFNPVLLLYILNTCMVLVDLTLYMRNRRFDEARGNAV